MYSMQGELSSYGIDVSHGSCYFGFDGAPQS